MATTFIQPGRVITVPAPFNVESGWLVVIGDLAGVAAGDALSGEPLDLALEGVFSLQKDSAAVLTVGQVAWAADGEIVESESDGDAPVGHVVEAAGAGVTTVKVRLSN